jgi:hypothetical protein
MPKAILIGSLLLSVYGSLSLSAMEKLQAPPAPFVAAEVVKAMPLIEAKSVIKTHGTKGAPQQNYAIVCGDNRLQLRQDQPLIQRLHTGGMPKPLMSISYWGSTKAGYGSPFKGDNAQVVQDKKSNALTVTKSFFASASGQKDGVFTEKIQVLEDGLINVDYSYRVPPEATVTDKGLFFSFRPFNIVAGMKILVDGNPHRVSDKGAPYGDRYVFQGKAREIIFNPDNPVRSFRLIFPQETSLYIKEKKKEADKGNRWKYFVEMRVHPPKDGHVSFKLDMRQTSGESLKTSNTFQGINFWKNDRLNIPDFAASRNLLPNPSFESGLRYYDNFFTWGTWPGRDYEIYAIDTAKARTGNRCLRISAWKSYPNPNYLSTFTIPTQPEKKYTFSFYAKAKGPKQRLDFTCVTAQWGKFPKWQSFNLSQEWKRYSLTITAPNTAATVMVRVRNFGQDEKADTLIDDLQFEQAEQATAFANPPFGSELTTSEPDNFLSLGQPVKAKMRIHAAPNQTGSIEYALKDFYYRELCAGKITFRTDARGEAIVDLPLDDKVSSGTVVLQADFSLGNGDKHRDFYRLTRMDLIDKNFKHRELFACGAGIRTCRGEASVKRLRGLGFGSNNYQTTEQQNDIFAKYGIRNTSSGVISYGPKGAGETDTFRKEIGKRVKTEPASGNLRSDIEKLSYQMVKDNPWVDEWFLQGECNAGGGKFKVLRDRDNEAFVNFILACYDGVKRADPSKRFALTGGPANMFKNGGIRDLDTWLDIVKKRRPSLTFDSIAIHPYRTVPESPDLDDDTATLIKMLKKHGYDKTPVYWNEGIYHNPWQIAEWGLDPHKGCSTDHWRAGTPTYDMGWGERIAAAYFARSWLVGLKYADHIKQYNGWSGTAMSLDTRMTPLALQKIPNTLGHLLGNATFKADIRFAPNVRAYVFEDKKKRPVAALWSHIPMVDRGFEPSPIADISFKDLKPETIDLMQNQVAMDMSSDGNARLPVSPFPLFIRTAPGTFDALCSSLREARLTGVDDFALNVSMTLKNRTEAEITFNNRLSRTFTGSADVLCKPQPVSKKLELAERASTTIDIKQAAPLSATKLSELSMPVRVAETNGKAVTRDLSLWCLAALKARSAITIDGDSDDWQGIPAIKTTNMKLFKSEGGTRSLPVSNRTYSGEKDLGVAYRLAWDENFLYLHVAVSDDTAWFPALKSASGDWSKDSLQVYIDTLGDNARRLSKESFDFNDYNYDISLTSATGKVNVFRRAAPEQQIAGGLDAPKPNTVEPNVKAAVKITATGYAVEVAFPRLLIAPLDLKPNTFFRLGLMVNDNDGKGRKGGMSNLPTKGMTPYANPVHWPGVLLVK